MTLTIYRDLDQGSEEWLAARCGLLTASVIGKLITAKTLKPAANDTARGVMEALVAERLTGRPDHFPMTADMERGVFDEPYARDYYSEHHAPVEEVGLMVLESEGRRIGYSPDGLVGDDGLIEIKSRKPKIQLRTVITDQVPAENMAQLQCGLFVSGRSWIDYTSWCGGMAPYIKRITPDPAWFDAIEAAWAAFESAAVDLTNTYRTATDGLLVPEYIDPYAEMEIV